MPNPEKPMGEDELHFLEQLKTKETGTERFLMYTEPEMLALDIPKPLWIADYIFPLPGLVAISGPWESYKTMFVLWTLRRLSAGLPLFHGEVDYAEPFTADKKPKAVNALFLEEEMTMGQIQERVSQMEGPHPSNMNYMVRSGFNFREGDKIQRLKDMMVEKGINIVICDPFSTISGVDDENANAEVSRIMDNMRELADSANACVGFIHHPAKSDKDRKSLRGAGDISGKVDIHLTIEKEHSESDTINVTFEKMRVANRQKVSGFKIRYTGNDILNDMHFTYIERLKSKREEWDEEKEKITNDILALLSDNAGWERKQVADTLNLSNSSSGKFGLVWGQLVDKGEIKKGRDKRFYVLLPIM